MKHNTFGESKNLKRNLLKRNTPEIMLLESKNLEKYNYEQQQSDKTQFWKGRIWKRATPERTHLKKYNYEQEDSEKGQTASKRTNMKKEILKSWNLELVIPNTNKQIWKRTVSFRKGQFWKRIIPKRKRLKISIQNWKIGNEQFWKGNSENEQSCKRQI